MCIYIFSNRTVASAMPTAHVRGGREQSRGYCGMAASQRGGVPAGGFGVDVSQCDWAGLF